MEQRALDNFDRLIAITNAHFPFNIVIALHLSRRPDINAVRKALDILQKRHAVLRCRVLSYPKYCFVFDVSTQIPLDEYWVDQKETWTLHA